MQVYRKLGLRLETAPDRAESGILNLSQRMRSGRLKVFGSLAKYLRQRRLYRWDENDQIVPGYDSLQDAVRCLVNWISRLSTQLKLAPVERANSHGSMGWAR